MTEQSTDKKTDNTSNPWKWGLFYFNPDDKRIFPPKRNPWMGWTVNFANPLSILAMLFLIAAIIIITAYVSETLLR